MPSQQERETALKSKEKGKGSTFIYMGSPHGQEKRLARVCSKSLSVGPLKTEEERVMGL